MMRIFLVAGLLIASASPLAPTPSAQAFYLATDKEKCYGIVQAGQGYDGSVHSSVPAITTKNRYKCEWKYVAKGTCSKEGGSTTPPPAHN